MWGVTWPTRALQSGLATEFGMVGWRIDGGADAGYPESAGGQRQKALGPVRLIIRFLAAKRTFLLPDRLE